MPRSQVPSRISLADLGLSALRRRRAKPEEKFHRAVAVLLRAILGPEVVWFHVPNGEKRDAITGARLKAMGALPGVPDLYLAWEGHTLWIELKAPKGTVSESQRTFAHRAIAIGQDVHVCRSVDEVLNVLDVMGVPMRAKAVA